MNYQFILNSIYSPKTASFWKKNHTSIISRFPEANIIHFKSDKSLKALTIHQDEIIVLIGNDCFFHNMVNELYDIILKNKGQNPICFMPDSENSSIGQSLSLPDDLEKMLDLIEGKMTIPFDMVRCHFIDEFGHPTRCLILNDALIGLPPMKTAVIFKSVFSLIKSLFSLSNRGSDSITLLQAGKLIYEGKFIFSLLLLGNKITNGPAFKKKIRVNRLHFEYFQLNLQPLYRIIQSLFKLSKIKTDSIQPNYIFLSTQALEIKSLDIERKIIADGKHIGRLPASFLILPKALRVIAPFKTIKVKSSWQEAPTTSKLVETQGS